MADDEDQTAPVTKYTFLKADSDEPLSPEDTEDANEDGNGDENGDGDGDGNGDESGKVAVLVGEGQSAEDVFLRNVELGIPCRARAEYPNGDVYVGGFNAAGEKEGKGTYTYFVPEEREDPNDPDSEVVKEASSYTYTGEWKANLRTGVGKIVYANGDSYHGQFLEGRRHGQGAYVKTNGDTYSGAWSDGNKHGQGIYVYKEDSSQLIGKWVQNKFKQGIWKMKDGTVYATEGTGRFVRNVPEGPGVFTFPGSGNVQRGEFITKKGVAQPVWKPLENTVV